MRLKMESSNASAHSVTDVVGAILWQIMETDTLVETADTPFSKRRGSKLFFLPGFLML
jgi:hypothetical protein